MTRKLIEVALPLEAINVAAAKEKSIRHGHPSTLHLWWARRPLAACRAVLFAQLVDDPGDLPAEFPTAELQQGERQRLWTIIEQMVPWENSNDAAVLEAAQREIARSAARAHGITLAHDADTATVADALRRYAPPVLDPFCGGGSIPLEAQRLGLEAHGSDLNPVAVLITKALIEIPPRFKDQPPVHPGAMRETGDWKGVRGLADDVHYYGQWMRDEAQRRIGHLYPTVTVPTSAGPSQATVIAWLWARTVPCPNPACGGAMPVVHSFVLSTKTGQKTWVEPIVDRSNKQVRFEVKTGTGTPPEGTKQRSSTRCIFCGTNNITDALLRAQGTKYGIGSQLMAIVAESKGGRIYISPPEQEIANTVTAPETAWLEQLLPTNPRWFSPPGYGLTTYRDLFTPRQLVALTTFSDLVGAARERAQHDALTAGLPDTGVPLHEGGMGAAAYADAVATYLGMGVSRMSDICNAFCRWENTKTQVRNLFSRQAIGMLWDFAEPNVFADAAGDFGVSLANLIKALEATPARGQGIVQQRDATAVIRDMNQPVISTDPPYYDNVGYADLSDFFYVWLRRSLNKVYPDLFSTLLVPKAQELIATPYRFGGDSQKAREFFEQGLGKAFQQMHTAQDPAYPLTVYYAFKQSEVTEDDEGMGSGTVATSTGWETMLEGLILAGFAITGTWPMRTELSNRPVASGTNALASSIVLVCRSRPTDAPLATQREFLRALKNELPPALDVLTGGRVAPVDLAQAAIGPGMAVYSRYARVLRPDGTRLTVRAALQAINEVIQTYFAALESDLDADTQFCLEWYKQFGLASGKYGDADTLSRAKNVSVDGLARDGLLRAAAGKVQLYGAGDAAYAGHWDPRTAHNFSLWAAVHRLVAAHTAGGDAAAAALVLGLGGYAADARALAYRLYDIAGAHGWTADALGYNNLVASWPAIQQEAAKLGTQAAQLGLGI